MFLVDTNVLSELRKVQTGRANLGVMHWQMSVPPELLYISAITLFELELGMLLIERRDPRQASMLKSWIEDYVVLSFLDRVLPVTDGIARHAAGLHVPDPLPLADSLIAATALVHGLTVVTRNVGDFRACPSFNPFA